MNLILTRWQADLNTNQRQSQQQRQGISISVLFCWGSRSAHLDPAGPSVNKQKEQSKRSLHGLLVNGFIYHNFWCFARGRYKGSMFWGHHFNERSWGQEEGLISVDYSASLCLFPPDVLLAQTELIRLLWFPAWPWHDHSGMPIDPLCLGYFSWPTVRR